MALIGSGWVLYEAYKTNGERNREAEERGLELDVIGGFSPP